MKQFNTSFTITTNLQSAKNSASPHAAAAPAAAIRTTGREYANPIDYSHPFESMARFAGFLALHYDANRTRHAYYRQVRLIHEYLQCDPVNITEAQLRDYFLFVKFK
jgi:hypothetical protein